MSNDYPPFDPKGARYDQSTFWGRFKHFLDVTDMRTLTVSQQELDEALDMLKRYEQGALKTKPTNEQLWRAKKIKEALVHPDTGEKIFLPFRVSAFVPVNVVICAGLLIPNASIGTTIFWQWVNQSYNIALNHANRNASNPMSNRQILESYTAAVAVSCSVALGMRHIVDKVLVTAAESLKNTIKVFIPFTAVSLAGVANVVIMRRNEMKEGIMVKDKEGNELGRSPTAGKKAVGQVALSRVLTSLPALLVPPIFMNALSKMPFVQHRPWVKLPINLALITIIFYTSLPAAIALFPQQSSVSVDKLEPQFQGLKDCSGIPIHTVYYNKGL
jgi:tricarboxylate carrier